MLEDEKTGVEQPTDAGTVAPTENAPENVSSQNEVKNEEVKVETPEIKNDGNDVEKFKGHIDNLNTALKQERESGKANKAKLETLERELQESRKILNGLGNVFAPQEKKEEETPPNVFSEDKLEEWWEQKEAERQRQTKLQERKGLIDKQISELETKWDGKDGKPKYDDSEMIKWQQDNEKMHLFPEEAFKDRYFNEIIDWETKQRLNKKPDVQNVERPGYSGDRQPKENNETFDSPEKQRAAIYDVVSQALDGSDNI